MKKIQIEKYANELDIELRNKFYPLYISTGIIRSEKDGYYFISYFINKPINSLYKIPKEFNGIKIISKFIGDINTI